MDKYQSEEQNLGKDLTENEIQLIDELYTEMYDKLLSLAKKKTHNTDLAKEIVQETFRIACVNIEKLKNSKNRQGWLVITLKNVTNNVLRGKSRLSSLFFRVSDIEEIAEEVQFNIEENLPDILYSDISGTEAYNLIKKIIFEQYTTVELAKEYGVSTDVIRQRIHRARLKLQDKINNKKN